MEQGKKEKSYIHIEMKDVQTIVTETQGRGETIAQEMDEIRQEEQCYKA